MWPAPPVFPEWGPEGMAVEVELAVAGLAANPDADGVAEHCATLTRYVRGKDGLGRDERCRNVVRGGAVPPALAALRAHAGTVAPLIAVTELFKALVRTVDQRDELCRMGVPAAFAMAANSLPDKSEVQHAVCLVLGNLAAGGEERDVRKLAVVQAGAVDLAMRCLDRFGAIEKMAQLGMWMLGNMAGPTTCSVIEAAGAIPAIVRAMSQHPASRDVVQWGPYSLDLISANSAGRATAVVDAGALPLIVAGAHMHLNSTDVAMRVVGFIVTMARATRDDAHVTKALVAANAHGTLLMALAAHASSEQIVRSCVGGLAALAASPACLAVLAAAGAGQACQDAASRDASLLPLVSKLRAALIAGGVPVTDTSSVKQQHLLAALGAAVEDTQHSAFGPPPPPLAVVHAAVGGAPPTEPTVAAAPEEVVPVRLCPPLPLLEWAAPSARVSALAPSTAVLAPSELLTALATAAAASERKTTCAPTALVLASLAASSVTVIDDMLDSLLVPVEVAVSAARSRDAGAASPQRQDGDALLRLHALLLQHATANQPAPALRVALLDEVVAFTTARGALAGGGSSPEEATLRGRVHETLRSLVVAPRDGIAMQPRQALAHVAELAASAGCQEQLEAALDSALGLADSAVSHRGAQGDGGSGEQGDSGSDTPTPASPGDATPHTPALVARFRARLSAVVAAAPHAWALDTTDGGSFALDVARAVDVATATLLAAGGDAATEYTHRVLGFTVGHHPLHRSRTATDDGIDAVPPAASPGGLPDRHGSCSAAFVLLAVTPAASTSGAGGASAQLVLATFLLPAAGAARPTTPCAPLQVAVVTDRLAFPGGGASTAGATTWTHAHLVAAGAHVHAAGSPMDALPEQLPVVIAQLVGSCSSDGRRVTALLAADAAHVGRTVTLSTQALVAAMGAEDVSRSMLAPVAPTANAPTDVALLVPGETGLLTVAARVVVTAAGQLGTGADTESTRGSRSHSTASAASVGRGSGGGAPAPAPAPAPGGFSFGAPAQAPAPGGFSFGAPAQAPAPGGFCAAPAPAPAPDGLFGGFGAAPALAPAPGGLFGGFGAAPAPVPAPGGLFGGFGAVPAPAFAPGGFSFGTPAPAPAPGGFSFGASFPVAAPAFVFGAPTFATQRRGVAAEKPRGRSATRDAAPVEEVPGPAKVVAPFTIAAARDLTVALALELVAFASRSAPLASVASNASALMLHAEGAHLPAGATAIASPEAPGCLVLVPTPAPDGAPMPLADLRLHGGIAVATDVFGGVYTAGLGRPGSTGGLELVPGQRVVPLDRASLRTGVPARPPRRLLAIAPDSAALPSAGGEWRRPSTTSAPTASSSGGADFVPSVSDTLVGVAPLLTDDGRIALLPANVLLSPRALAGASPAPLLPASLLEDAGTPLQASSSVGIGSSISGAARLSVIFRGEGGIGAVLMDGASAGDLHPVTIVGVLPAALAPVVPSASSVPPPISFAVAPAPGAAVGGPRVSVEELAARLRRSHPGVPPPLVSEAAMARTTLSAALKWAVKRVGAQPGPGPLSMAGASLAASACWTALRGLTSFGDGRFRAESSCTTVRAQCSPLTGGRWYWEMRVDDSRSTGYVIGVANVSGSLADDFRPGDELFEGGVGHDAKSWGWAGADRRDVVAIHKGVRRPFGARCYDDTVVGIALDVDAGVMWLRCDGTWQAAPLHTGITVSRGLVPVVSAAKGTRLRFCVGDRNSEFQHAPPPGYRGLWEAMLEPLFTPAKPAVAPLDGPAPLAVVPGVIDLPIAPPGLEPSTVVRGPSHGVALTAGGRAIAFGSNARGQCGWGKGHLDADLGRTAAPMLLLEPGGAAGAPAFSVAAVGEAHSLLLDGASGCVWACGANDAGQCGSSGPGSPVVCPLLRRVPFPAGVRIVAIAAAAAYSAVVDEDGRAWAWGAVPGVAGAAALVLATTGPTLLSHALTSPYLARRWARLAATGTALALLPAADPLAHLPPASLGAAAACVTGAPAADTVATTLLVVPAPMPSERDAGEAGLWTWATSPPTPPLHAPVTLGAPLSLAIARAPEGAATPSLSAFDRGSTSLWAAVSAPSARILQLRRMRPAASVPTGAGSHVAPGLLASAAAGVLLAPFLSLATALEATGGVVGALLPRQLALLLALDAALSAAGGAPSAIPSRKLHALATRTGDTQTDAALRAIALVGDALRALACTSALSAHRSVLLLQRALGGHPAHTPLGAFVRAALARFAYARVGGISGALTWLEADAAVSELHGLLRDAAATWLARAAPAWVRLCGASGVQSSSIADARAALLGPSPGPSSGHLSVSGGDVDASGRAALARRVGAMLVSLHGESTLRMPLLSLLAGIVACESGALPTGPAAPAFEPALMRTAGLPASSGAEVVLDVALRELESGRDHPQLRCLVDSAALAAAADAQAAMDRMAASNAGSLDAVEFACRRALRVARQLAAAAMRLPGSPPSDSDVGAPFTAHRLDSAHPYRPDPSEQVNVLLPAAPAARLVRVAFDPRCGTVQPQDTLTLRLVASPSSAPLVATPQQWTFHGPPRVPGSTAGAAEPAHGWPYALVLELPAGASLQAVFATGPFNPDIAPPAAHKWGVGVTVTTYATAPGGLAGAGTEGPHAAHAAMVAVRAQLLASVAMAPVDTAHELASRSGTVGAVSASVGGRTAMTPAVLSAALRPVLLRHGFAEPQRVEAAAGPDAAVSDSCSRVAMHEASFVAAVVGGEPALSPGLPAASDALRAAAAAFALWLDGQLASSHAPLAGSSSPQLTRARTAVMAILWHVGVAESLVAAGAFLARTGGGPASPQPQLLLALTALVRRAMEHPAIRDACESPVSGCIGLLRLAPAVAPKRDAHEFASSRAPVACPLLGAVTRVVSSLPGGAPPQPLPSGAHTFGVQHRTTSSGGSLSGGGGADHWELVKWGERTGIAVAGAHDVSAAGGALFHAVPVSLQIAVLELERAVTGAAPGAAPGADDGGGAGGGDAPDVTPEARAAVSGVVAAVLRALTSPTVDAAKAVPVLQRSALVAGLRTAALELLAADVLGAAGDATTALAALASVVAVANSAPRQDGTGDGGLPAGSSSAALSAGASMLSCHWGLPDAPALALVSAKRALLEGAARQLKEAALLLADVGGGTVLSALAWARLADSHDVALALESGVIDSLQTIAEFASPPEPLSARGTSSRSPTERATAAAAGGIHSHAVDVLPGAMRDAALAAIGTLLRASTATGTIQAWQSLRSLARRPALAAGGSFGSSSLPLPLHGALARATSLGSESTDLRAASLAGLHGLAARLPAASLRELQTAALDALVGDLLAAVGASRQLDALRARRAGGAVAGGAGAGAGSPAGAGAGAGGVDALVTASASSSSVDASVNSAEGEGAGTPPRRRSVSRTSSVVSLGTLVEAMGDSVKSEAEEDYPDPAGAGEEGWWDGGDAAGALAAATEYANALHAHADGVLTLLLSLLPHGGPSAPAPASAIALDAGGSGARVFASLLCYLPHARPGSVPVVVALLRTCLAHSDAAALDAACRSALPAAAAAVGAVLRVARRGRSDAPVGQADPLCGVLSASSRCLPCGAAAPPPSGTVAVAAVLLTAAAGLQVAVHLRADGGSVPQRGKLAAPIAAAAAAPLPAPVARELLALVSGAAGITPVAGVSVQAGSSSGAEVGRAAGWLLAACLAQAQAHVAATVLLPSGQLVGGRGATPLERVCRSVGVALVAAAVAASAPGVEAAGALSLPSAPSAPTTKAGAPSSPPPLLPSTVGTLLVVQSCARLTHDGAVAAVYPCNAHADGHTLAAFACAACAGRDDVGVVPGADVAHFCASCDAAFHLPPRMRAHARTALTVPAAVGPGSGGGDSGRRPLRLDDGSVRLSVRAVTIAVHGGNCAGVVDVDAAGVAALVEEARAEAVAAADGNGGEGEQRPSPGGAAAGAAPAHSAAALLAAAAALDAGCKYCGDVLVSPGAPTCARASCVASDASACHSALPCGHACGGSRASPAAAHDDSAPCLPWCWEGCGGAVPPDGVSGGSYCQVCHAEPLRDAPCVQLSACGHVFHAHCVRRVLETGPPGIRWTLGFLGCPQCRARIDAPALADALAPYAPLLAELPAMVTAQLREDGLPPLPEGGGGDAFAALRDALSSRYDFYPCSGGCKRSFFGGRHDCRIEGGGGPGGDIDPGGGPGGDEAVNRDELVCGPCSARVLGSSCARHGDAAVTFKCRYCCSLAVFFCFGTTHFCNQCHSSYSRMQDMAKAGRLPACPAGPCGTQLPGGSGDCPLRVQHPPTGTEHIIGCATCMQEAHARAAARRA